MVKVLLRTLGIEAARATADHPAVVSKCYVLPAAVYIAPDPGAKDKQAKNGIYPFPIAEYFDKGIIMGIGQAPVKKYNEYLRDLIVSGRAKPSRIVSHHIQIDDAPEAYDKFDQRIEGYTKVLIRFGQRAA